MKYDHDIRDGCKSKKSPKEMSSVAGSAQHILQEQQPPEKNLSSEKVLDNSSIDIINNLEKQKNPHNNKLPDIAPNNRRYTSSAEMSPEINHNSKNRLSLEQRLYVIKAYATDTIDTNELCKMFNCDGTQISDIIQNRHDILNFFQENKCQYNLNTRMEIIKAVDSNLDRNQIRKQFKCSLRQIESTLRKRDTIQKLYDKYAKGSQSSSSVQLKNSAVNRRKSRRLEKPKPKKVFRKILSLDERIEVLRVYSPNVTYAKLASKFNCSPFQIKNCILHRKQNIEKYKILHPEFDEQQFLALKNFKHKFEKSHKKLSCKESVELIKAFDRKKNYSKVARLFGCSIKKARNIVKNRKAIMGKWKVMKLENELKNVPSKNINQSNNDVSSDNINDSDNISCNQENDQSPKETHQESCRLLSLDERVNIMKAYNRNEFSLTKLTYIFNCTMTEIKNIIFNHEATIAEYKKQHPEFDENEIKFPNFNTDSKYVKHNTRKLTLRNQKELIEAYDNVKSLAKVARLFRCDAKRVKAIVQNREAIMERYENENNSNNGDGYSKESDKCDNKKMETTNELFSNVDFTDLIVSFKINNNVLDCADIGHSSNTSKDANFKTNDNEPDCIKNTKESKKAKVNKNCHRKYINSKKRNQEVLTESSIETQDGEISNQKSLQNYLTLDDCVAVINAVDRNLSRQEICDKFNCTSEQIEEFLQKRNDLMDFYENNVKQNINSKTTANHDYSVVMPLARSNLLTLEQRIDVIKKFYRDSISVNKLSSMFCCSIKEIQNILYRRKEFLNKYKKLHPEFSLNGFQISKTADNETKKCTRNKLTFEKCIEVIKSFEQCKNYFKLARLFRCSYSQIRKILQNREAIIKRFQTGQKKLTTLNCSNNPTDFDGHQSANCGEDEDNQSKNKKNNDDKNEFQSILHNENNTDDSNETTSENYLTLERCVSILKAVDIGLAKNDICKIFKCSLQQIEDFLEKRADIMEFYAKNSTGDISRPLDLEELINVIKTYHRYKLSFYKLSSLFNCSIRQIEKAIHNRNELMEAYMINHPDFDDSELKVLLNRRHETLSLEQRMDVVKAYEHNNYTSDKLSYMFNCSVSQIENILFNRKSIIEEYNKQNSKCYGNTLEVQNTIQHKIANSRFVNKLSLEKCIEVIKSYDHDKNCARLGRLYNCGAMQIKSIIRKRKVILKTYQMYRKSFSGLNNVDSNASISTLICETACKKYTNESTSNTENMSLTQITEKSTSDDKDDNQPNSNDSIRDEAVKEKIVFRIQHNGTENAIDQVKKNRKSNNFNINSRSSNIKNKLNSKSHSLQMQKSVNNVSKNLDPLAELESTPDWGKLDPTKYLKVIEAYDQKTTIAELSRRFNCSETLINHILKSRQAILKNFGEPLKQSLSLHKRIEVIGSRIRHNYSYQQLARLFRCPLSEITLCLRNRNHFIDAFKKQYPKLKQKLDVKLKYKIITLEESIKVLEAFDKCPDAPLLGYWFNYPSACIQRIVADREQIMNRHKKLVKSINQSNLFKNLEISSYNDIALALGPIKTFADVTQNAKAINITFELEEHLEIRSSTNNNSNINNDLPKKIEISTFKDAINALKPIEDYVQLSDNLDAKEKMLELREHLIAFNTRKRRSKYEMKIMHKVNKL